MAVTPAWGILALGHVESAARQRSGLEEWEQALLVLEEEGGKAGPLGSQQVGPLGRPPPVAPVVLEPREAAQGGSVGLVAEPALGPAAELKVPVALARDGGRSCGPETEGEEVGPTGGFGWPGQQAAQEEERKVQTPWRRWRSWSHWTLWNRWSYHLRGHCRYPDQAERSLPA